MPYRLIRMIRMLGFLEKSVIVQRMEDTTDGKPELCAKDKHAIGPWLVPCREAHRCWSPEMGVSSLPGTPGVLRVTERFYPTAARPTPLTLRRPDSIIYTVHNLLFKPV